MPSRCDCGKWAMAGQIQCQSCNSPRCRCGRLAVYNRTNCKMCTATSFEPGTCCFCGNECNPASQACGACPRNLFFRGAWTY